MSPSVRFTIALVVLVGLPVLDYVLDWLRREEPENRDAVAQRCDDLQRKNKGAA